MSDDLFYFINKLQSVGVCLELAIYKGLNIWKDPFMNSLREAMELSNKMIIKNKSKIVLADSCTLMGVLDPFDILEENELFVQINRNT